MIQKKVIIGSLIVFAAYAGFISPRGIYSQEPSGAGKSTIGAKPPTGQAQQIDKSKGKTPPEQALSPSSSPSSQGGYYLTIEKVSLVNKSIHILLKNTGSEKVPPQAYTAGKLGLKSQTLSKKWTLSEVDPGQMLNKLTKTVDFDTRLHLAAAESVEVALENLKGDRSKRASLTPALSQAGIKRPIDKPTSAPPPSGTMRAELPPAGIHSQGIVIGSPRLGERYHPGNTLTVRFTVGSLAAETYGPAPTSFKAVLYHESAGGRAFPVIYEGPLHEAAYVIPPDAPQSDQYQVYVAGVENPNYYCTTGKFTIRRLSIDEAASSSPGSPELAPYLRVVGPEAYATWNKGCSYRVSWRSNVAPVSTVVSLVDAAGREVASARPSTVTTVSEGSYSASFWVPNGPDVPSSGAYYGYRLKVAVDRSGSPLSGQAEALKVQESSMTVDRPAGETTFCRGWAGNITWSYAGCRGRTYRITLLTDLPLGVAPRVISPSVAFAPTTDVGGYLFQQTYSWTVPADLREGTYRIQVETNPTSFAEARVSGTSRQFMIHSCR